MLGQRLLGRVLMALVATFLLLAPPASAQGTTTGACEDDDLAGAQCGRVSVPLDHAAPQGARLALSYVRYPARSQRRGTVVFLAGGPGQAATPLAPSVSRGALRGLRSRYDLVFVDQRGTGASSPLSCSTAPRGTFRIPDDASSTQAAAAVRRCADELGTTRRFFSTYETVLDLEDVRAALGVEKIIPLGVSYGGQVAGEYARRYPTRVAAMVLDSTSPIEGRDTLDRLPQLALPRVLREVCFPPGCGRILGDPQEILRRAVARLSRRPLAGRVVLPSGRTRSGLVGVTDVYALLLASDLDPALRTALPAALEAAARGDAAPLLRLAQGGGGAPAEEAVNEVRFLATTCTEGRLPWAPESDPASRPALLEQALREQAGAYGPFPVEAVAPQLTATLCLGWSATERPPFPPAPNNGPAVPVLVIGGREDLRTPLEDQRRAAGQFPRARVLAVPNVGHSVLGSDTSGCAATAVRAFLAGQAFGTCVRRERDIPLALPVFQDLDEVPNAAGTGLPAVVERTATAVDVTLRDAVRQLAAVAAGSSNGDVSSRRVRVGGLLEVTASTVRLVGYEVVRGVRLTGRLRSEGTSTLTIGGSGATGTLLVSESGSFTGRLDGVRVRYRPRPVGAG